MDNTKKKRQIKRGWYLVLIAFITGVMTVQASFNYYLYNEIQDLKEDFKVEVKK